MRLRSRYQLESRLCMARYLTFAEISASKTTR